MTEVKEKKKRGVKAEVASVAAKAPRVAGVVVRSATLDALTGQKVCLSVELTDITPKSYKWTKNGAEVAGQTGAVLVIPAAAASDVGSYKCKVTPVNGAEVESSNECALTVSAAVAGTVKEYDVAINEFHGVGYTHAHWEDVNKLLAILKKTETTDKFSDKFKTEITTDPSLYNLHCAFVSCGGNLVITDSRDGYQYTFKSNSNKNSVVKSGPMVNFWK